MTTLKWPDALVFLKGNPGRVVRCDRNGVCYDFNEETHSYGKQRSDGVWTHAEEGDAIFVGFHDTFTVLPAEDESDDYAVENILAGFVVPDRLDPKFVTRYAKRLRKLWQHDIKQTNKGK